MNVCVGTEVESLEGALAAMHGRGHGVLLGSGTIGLALSLKAAGLEGSRVAIPASVCLNVPLAVLYAGCQPVYCDVDPSDLGISPKSLERHIDEVRAVVAVHAYGNPCQIDAIADLCRSRNVFLIEDAATAQGVTVNGSPVGTFGQCAVLSFGPGKVIDADGGGAVLADDPSLTDSIRALYRTLPLRAAFDDQALSDFSRAHTALYNQCFVTGTLAAQVPAFRRRAIELGTSTLTRAPVDIDRVRTGLNHLPELVGRRRKNAEFFREWVRTSAPSGIMACDQIEGAVPWRFNLLLQNSRNEVLASILSQRFPVSSWYPPACEFLESKDAVELLPVASRIGGEILNLWVNETIDDGYKSQIVMAIAGAAAGALS